MNAFSLQELMVLVVETSRLTLHERYIFRGRWEGVVSIRDRLHGDWEFLDTLQHWTGSKAICR